jgi:hypothetical protein
MSRKDYALIAATIKNLAPEYRNIVAYDFADALLKASPFDNNGNRSFKEDRFLTACGVENV